MLSQSASVKKKIKNVLSENRSPNPTSSRPYSGEYANSSRLKERDIRKQEMAKEILFLKLWKSGNIYIFEERSTHFFHIWRGYVL
jgi:hypothetical protein